MPSGLNDVKASVTRETGQTVVHTLHLMQASVLKAGKSRVAASWNVMPRSGLAAAVRMPSVSRPAWLGITPAGMRFDLLVSDDGNTTNDNWDSFWTSKTTITDEGWFVEVKIPFSTLGFITDDSGGRTEIVRDFRDLDPAVAGIADELSRQYFLGYSSNAPKDGRWHAIEVRLCAESPTDDFLPGSGTIVDWSPPTGVRCDHALRAGAEVEQPSSVGRSLLCGVPARQEIVGRVPVPVLPLEDLPPDREVVLRQLVIRHPPAP